MVWSLIASFQGFAVLPYPAINSREENVNDKLFVSGLGDAGNFSVLYTKELYEERWDTLSQTQFWRKVMRLSPDSGFLNVAASRTIAAKICTKDWLRMKESDKNHLMDSIHNQLCLGEEDYFLFTVGKSDFYKISSVLSSIDKAVKIFEQEETDPFYAQTILLIESPGRMQKSTVGAFGSFQLMRAVAIRMGLKVNKHVDERRDFDKSAWAAAKLLRTICIPETKAILERHGIAYHEKDLWFRLLVLHVYHAGAGNVAPIVEKICPSAGNRELIRQVWQTSHGAFRNSSQNYSQLALASLLELDALILNQCGDVKNCK